MTMTTAQDELFTTFLRDKANEAFQVVKPWPGHFLRMLESKGGYLTAVELIAKRTASDGFARLWEAKRLDLTVEALVVETQWRQYFDPELLKMAEKRLRQSDYEAKVPVLPPAGAAVAPLEQSATPRTPLPFVLGGRYNRSDVFKVVGIDPETVGGPWFTGYTNHDGSWFIFCNVGAAGRTGHDYDNHFEGDRLVWFGKGPSKVEHPSIQNLLAPLGSVYIFFRAADRDPFTFAGIAKPFEVVDQTPVRVTWDFYSPGAAPGDEGATSGRVTEGAAKTRLTKVYERDRGARLTCVGEWGWTCAVCKFDFADEYGELGVDFIHVHHLKPLAEIGKAYELDPVKDLRPVCPNCHAMLHRENPALGIEKLKERMRQHKAARTQAAAAMPADHSNRG